MTEERELTKGEGRTKVTLSARYLGSDPIVWIYNNNVHVDVITETEIKESMANVDDLTDEFIRREHKNG